MELGQRDAMTVCTHKVIRRKMNTGKERKGGRKCAYRGSPVGETLPIISFVSAPLTGCCMTERRSPTLTIKGCQQTELHIYTASVTKTAFSVTHRHHTYHAISELTATRTQNPLTCGISV